jgi:hypothetical protein
MCYIVREIDSKTFGGTPSLGKFSAAGKERYFLLLTWELINHIPRRCILGDYKLRQDFEPKIEDKFKKKPKKICDFVFFTYSRICTNFVLYFHKNTLRYVSCVATTIHLISFLTATRIRSVMCHFYRKITPNFCSILS